MRRHAHGDFQLFSQKSSGIPEIYVSRTVFPARLFFFLFGTCECVICVSVLVETPHSDPSKWWVIVIGQSFFSHCAKHLFDVSWSNVLTLPTLEYCNL